MSTLFERPSELGGYNNSWERLVNCLGTSLVSFNGRKSAMSRCAEKFLYSDVMCGYHLCLRETRSSSISYENTTVKGGL